MEMVKLNETERRKEKKKEKEKKEKKRDIIPDRRKSSTIYQHNI